MLRLDACDYNILFCSLNLRKIVRESLVGLRGALVIFVMYYAAKYLYS